MLIVKGNMEKRGEVADDNLSYNRNVIENRKRSKECSVKDLIRHKQQKKQFDFF